MFIRNSTLFYFLKILLNDHAKPKFIFKLNFMLENCHLVDLLCPNSPEVETLSHSHKNKQKYKVKRKKEKKGKNIKLMLYLY